MDKLKYAYVPNVTQIRFFDFNDKRAPREYWSHINDIADLVAHRLCGMGSTYEHVGCTSTTILVQQHKEKFGGARVYCILADASLVAAAWKNDGNADAPSEEFIHMCRVRDAKHYRETYRMVFGLCPQYYSAVRYDADYPALLCETREELDELLCSEYHAGWERDDRATLFEICGFDDGEQRK
jgi:hypothetical protein